MNGPRPTAHGPRSTNRRGSRDGLDASARRRVQFVLLAFVVFMGSIGIRLVSFQVLRGDDLGQSARLERVWDRAVPARRGTVYDRNGLTLAGTVPADLAEADLNRIAPGEQDERVVLREYERLARALAGPLAMSPDEILARLRKGRERGQVAVPLKRYLTPEQSEGVRKLGLKCMASDAPCIVLTPEPRRVYPNGDFAAQLLGFVNWKLEGEYGVERAYNGEIGGRPGHARTELDVAGHAIAIGQNTVVPPVDGLDAVLTIDAAVQRAAEQQLEGAIRGSGASGGTVIVMDVRTGAILALANRPSFDPNGFEQFDLAAFDNPAVGALYEPGSTMKVLTVAIGLETGAVDTNTVFHDAPGYLQVGEFRIKNANGAVWGRETPSEILQHSSNLGAAFVARRVGPDRFYAKLREFGIGAATGIDLPGEEEGIVNWPDAPDWRPINLATNAFGQGITATPLQMITAVSAVVNGGRLMRPYVVKELRDGDRTARTIEPQLVRQVVSPAVSRAVTGMLTEVVDNVSHPYVGVSGYAVGAKSGTAFIPAADGGYEDEETTIGSMIAVGPAENPRFAVLVKIDRPQKDSWGSRIAGPPARQILLDLFTMHGIPPTRRQP